MGLTGTTTPGQSEHGSNGNEWVFNTPQSFKTVASSSDPVECYTQDTLFLCTHLKGSKSFTISIF